MTERLRDLVDVEDPALAELARLVRAADDLDPPPGAQERVRCALAEPRPHRRRLRRPVLVFLVLVVVLPLASAGVRRLVAPAPRPAPVRSVADDHTKPVLAHPGAAMRASPPSPPAELRTDEPAAALEVAPPPEPIPARTQDPTVAPAAPRTAPRPEPAPPPIRARAPDPTVAPDAPRIAPHPEPAAQPTPARAPDPTEAPRAPPTAAAQPRPDATSPGRSLGAFPRTANPGPERAPASTPEATLVLEAVHLLHHDHDARGALRQLDAYRARFPDGDLAEEALALSIEACVTLDDGAATALAELYLRRFPRGRFRELAERARHRLHDR